MTALFACAAEEIDLLNQDVLDGTSLLFVPGPRSWQSRFRMPDSDQRGMKKRFTL